MKNFEEPVSVENLDQQQTLFRRFMEPAELGLGLERLAASVVCG